MLYIVATPIGNLKDISLRALEVLKEADLILCEDTRVTKKLLDRYDIKTPTLSYHQHSKLQRVQEIKALLQEGKNLALVSDAGTPGVSDPGNQLIGELSEVEIHPIPGPSALVAVASIAGFSMDKFVFMGFPPKKRKRSKFFKEVVQSEYPVIFYESPHRILKSLEELCALEPTLQVVVARELTKKFETIYRGTIDEVLKELQNSATKGEFVIVVQHSKKRGVE